MKEEIEDIISAYNKLKYQRGLMFQLQRGRRNSTPWTDKQEKKKIITIPNIEGAYLIPRYLREASIMTMAAKGRKIKDVVSTKEKRR